MISEISITAKYLRISPSKVQKVASLIQGKSYKDAVQTLESLPSKISYKVWKVLKEVTANATHNYFLVKENLIISKVYVSRGPILKRIQPRAKGKAYRIEKKFSHLTISVKSV